MARFVTFRVSGDVFETPTRYSDIEPLYLGTSWHVCSAKDKIRQQLVMIRRLPGPSATATTAKHSFREIKLLKHLKHENIVNLADIFISPSDDLYVVMDLMETDLQTLLKARPIEQKFVQYFLYEIMRGLKYAHSAGVVHHNLKPSNILVNRNCDLKICNFGLAQAQGRWMMGCISTIYSAPEDLLTGHSYDQQADIWSAGCVFAELLLGKPLFLRQNYIHQLHAIIELLGSPLDDTFPKETTPNTLNFIHLLPRREGKSLFDVFPRFDPSAVNLLKRLLVLDPCGRATASEALTFPYLAPYHDPTDEPEAQKKFDWTFTETYYPSSVWKSKMFAEVLNYHEEVELQESVRCWLEAQPMAMD